ncbi:uncharacterized protein L969DRAFT_334238 [Mixia osmundae IAM 14324]|uniref:Mitochondrial import inner membrane translocase subunit TIM44 n=1 Tax=Mixia osmundae (strain CBS 9802 / IAM 14324 / JCM 22182 / KY 12970) TaxID=764103 RepID=G7E6A1_MIXOS|nr:uncharacterized protein L969DRAFT_334238 [Mixia osmundae IAM 14324]KEI40482.1 hypothetical protein L969DRAFT_334238 [Mixia osmundae IAM 14324]GAA98361.1 hypothetical protein E5Q_05047 [Mixia osmundae IAM 14324]
MSLQALRLAMSGSQRCQVLIALPGTRRGLRHQQRQLASLALTSARMRSSSLTLPQRMRRPFSVSATSHRPSPDPSSSSSSSKADQRAREKKERDDRPAAGKSPFAAFVDVLRDELRKNQDFQDSVRQLQGEAGKVTDSEAMKRAGAIYERARLTASIRENPKLRAAAENLKAAGLSVSDAVGTALDSFEQNPVIRGSRAALRKAGESVYDASEPIRKTEAYKTVASSVVEALDDVGSNVRYGGYVEKEDRRRRREARLAKIGRAPLRPREKVAENPEAGENIVLHATASTSESQSTQSRLPAPVAKWLAGLKESYNESENPIVGSMRTVTSTLGRVFAETETSRVQSRMKELDPSFQMEAFLRELREYMVPEMVDAYSSADLKTLKEWCSEATYSVLTASIQPYLSKGLVPDSRVLDIRGVDIAAAKVLENETNVFVVSFRTQEITAFRDPKTGEVAAGSEDQIDQCGYVMVMTRIEEELENPITAGWKVIDIARRAQKAFM